MNATPTAPGLPAPEHQALVFAGRFTLIIADLVALIARAFLRHPELVALTIPLCSRLSRNARHLAAIMARLAAGSLRPRRPGTSGSRAPKPPIPATHAWLVRTLRHEAAAYASQLSHLLREPGVAELLAAAPTTGRLLRPLCRMLGIPATALPAVASDRCAPSRTESSDTPLRGVASQATGALPRQRQQRSRVARAGRLESAVEPSRLESAAPPPPAPRPAPTAPPPPLCPRLRLRWPFQRPSAKPA